MILHVALFHWQAWVSEPDVDALTAELEHMAAELPVLRQYRCGPNVRVRPSPADYVVIAVVDDAQALEAYLDSPAHARVYETHLARMIETREAAQLSVTEGFRL